MATKVTLYVAPVECLFPKLPGPDYMAMIHRRLPDNKIKQGDSICWNIGGRRIDISIVNIQGEPDDCGYFTVVPNVTELELLPFPTPERIGQPTDSTLQSLVAMISEGFEHLEAFRRLGLSTAKSILVHGPSGVGKTTLVKQASEYLGCHVISTSVYDLLELKEEWTLPAFNNYNPLHLSLSRALETAPVILVIRDLDAIGKDEKPVDILKQELGRISDVAKVCVVGLARQLTKLPMSLQKTDIFQQHFTLGIPTLQQRKTLLNAMLSDFHLPNEVVDDLVAQTSLRTSGYVARDLAMVCRNAKLKSLRRLPTTEESLIHGLSQLKLDPTNPRQPTITWEDLAYALEIHKPSQQMEVETLLPKRQWDEIGGYETMKRRIRQATVIPLLQPELFQRLGVPAPSGLLLYGPSGCGKTALVQALATEAMMNVIAINGPQIYSKYLGDTERSIRRLFATAKRIAPCLIVIDEMDAIACRRGWNGGGEGGVNERVLSTLLNEMDGVEGRQGVLVIGCTNRPHQIDDAILRPGRLDQLLYVGMPDEQDRQQIMEAIKRHLKADDDVNTQDLAKHTTHCTGADLQLLFREAATVALRENTKIPAIAQRHLNHVLPSICTRASQRETSLQLFEQFQAKHRI